MYHGPTTLGSVRVHYVMDGVAGSSTGTEPQERVDGIGFGDETETEGDADAPGFSLIFIHGIGSSLQTWRPVMNRLSSRHQVLGFDLVGHGDSPVPDDPEAYSRDRALDDIDDLIEVATGAPVLVGHSLGGYLALAHAATRPGVARGLIVLNTGPGFRDPAKRKAWNERSRRNADRFGVVPQAAELNLQHDSVVMDNLATMDLPVLVLAGSEDRPEYASAGRYMESKMTQCRFVSVEGGRHDMHAESHVEAIADLVDSFVAGIG